MPSALKEDVKDILTERANEMGLNGQEFFEMIADEKVATSEEEVLEFITKKNHPAVALEPMF